MAHIVSFPGVMTSAFTDCNNRLRGAPYLFNQIPLVINVRGVLCGYTLLARVLSYQGALTRLHRLNKSR